MRSTPACCANVTCRNGRRHSRRSRRRAAARRRTQSSASCLPSAREQRCRRDLARQLRRGQRPASLQMSNSSSSERPRDVPDERRERGLRSFRRTPSSSASARSRRISDFPGARRALRRNRANAVEIAALVARHVHGAAVLAISPKYWATPSCGVSSVSFPLVEFHQVQVVVARGSDAAEQTRTGHRRNAGDRIRSPDS